MKFNFTFTRLIFFIVCIIIDHRTNSICILWLFLYSLKTIDNKIGQRINTLKENCQQKEKEHRYKC